MPQVIPMLSYEDTAAALDWLATAFGFRERTRMAGPDGRIGHAEMEIDDGVIFLASPTPDYEGPAHHAKTCARAARWLAVPLVIDGIHVFVDDVDQHFARARDAGATILSEPEDQEYGERVYRAADVEGHRWMFGQYLA
jgi:PhnB protein